MHYCRQLLAAGLAFLLAGCGSAPQRDAAPQKPKTDSAAKREPPPKADVKVAEVTPKPEPAPAPEPKPEPKAEPEPEPEPAPAPKPASTFWWQWRGADRSGVSPETGLMKKWPDGGPKKLWTADCNLGKSYASMSIKDDTIYTSGTVAGQGVVFALDLDGKLLWKTQYGKEWAKKKFGSSRTTPTIDGDRLYVYSGMAILACLNRKDGSIRWKIDARKVYKAKLTPWGATESPLVVGDKVLCSPGSPGSWFVALDKMTGKLVWKAKGKFAGPMYCNPVLVDHNGRDIIITMSKKNVVGVNPEDGSTLWSSGYTSKFGGHTNTPLYHKGMVFCTSGYNAGGVMLKIADDGNSAAEVWRNKDLDTHHGGVVRIGEYLYGSSWQSNSEGNWVCLRWSDGEKMFDTKWNNKGSIIAAEGMIYIYDEKSGNVGLAPATPDRLEIVSSFKITEGADQHWAHPIIHNKRLYIRHGACLMAYDIAAQ